MIRGRTGAALVAEAFGTFLFFFVGAGAVVLGDYLAASGGTGPGLLGVALAHGLALAVLASALGAVSGGHFNPAVTLGVWIMGRITPMGAALYVVAQLIGGLVAGLALKAVFANSWQASNIGTPALGAGITPVLGIGIEAVLTALLLLVVIGTTIDSRGPKLGGLAVGLAVTADILVGGPLTGAAMNPARWFGPAVASGDYTNWYVWWIGPLIGAIVGAVIYRYALAGEAEPEVTPATPDL
jgi:MIP family channel proteins